MCSSDLGDRTLHVLFEPTERTSLAGFSTTKNHVLITTLDNVRNRLFTLAFRDGQWRKEPLPGVPEIGTGSVIPVDDIEGDDFFLVTSSSLEPSTLALGTVGGAAPEKLKQAPAFFDAQGLKLTQHEAVSKDGTKVPYFQIGPKDLPLNGSTPTLLYG